MLCLYSRYVMYACQDWTIFQPQWRLQKASPRLAHFCLQMLPRDLIPIGALDSITRKPILLVEVLPHHGDAPSALKLTLSEDRRGKFAPSNRGAYSPCQSSTPTVRRCTQMKSMSRYGHYSCVQYDLSNTVRIDKPQKQFSYANKTASGSMCDTYWKHTCQSDLNMWIWVMDHLWVMQRSRGSRSPQIVMFPRIRWGKSLGRRIVHGFLTWEPHCRTFTASEQLPPFLFVFTWGKKKFSNSFLLFETNKRRKTCKIL